MTWRKKGFAKIIEQLPVGVAVTLPTGMLEYANPYLCNLLGISREEAIGAPLASFVFADDGSRTEVRCPQTEKKQLRTRNGEMFDVLESVYAHHDDAGNVTHLMHMVQDFSAQKQLDILSALAFYDNLTGLPNRNLLNDRLERTLSTARRKRTAFALFYIDIDHFKKVNDTLGHECGDELLRQVAARLGRSLRSNDSIGRWGGDEFIAVLEGVSDPQVAVSIGHKLLQLCGKPYQLRGETHRITLSIGMSFYPRDADNIPALLEIADRTMYAVKTDGRNGFWVAAASITDPAPKDVH
jgi:diguanylate cyclase (GGDEF)-like protein/PAS domain S-box-containing protein